MNPRGKLIRRSATLVLAVCLSSLQAAGGRAMGTRPGHARPPGASVTHAAGHATYGHSVGYGSRYAYSHGHLWYPWLGCAFWPSWGLWQGPQPHPSRGGGEAGASPALIEIDVRPGKAELRIDSEVAGEARDFNGRFDLLALKPGRHVMEFSRPGYQTLRLVVDAAADGYLRIDDRLARGAGLDPRSDELPAPAAADRIEELGEIPATGQSDHLADGLLRVRVQPADAAVYLDGEFLARGDELGRLHGALPVAQGVHSIEVVRPGFQSQSRKVEVQGEQPVTVEIELRRSDPAEVR